VDPGCTGNFLLVTAPCLNKVKSRKPLTVRLPNGATMEFSHTADLDIPELNDAASKAHVSLDWLLNYSHSHSRTPPPVRARTDARMNPSPQRATQLRSVLARVYAVSIQNQITTTVP
jgi:hypothetical protein